MALPQSAYKDRQFLAVIGDEVSNTYCQNPTLLTRIFQDSVTGVLLAGVGVCTATTHSRGYL